jgi:hypothetical protein
MSNTNDYKPLTWVYVAIHSEQPVAASNTLKGIFEEIDIYIGYKDNFNIEKKWLPYHSKYPDPYQGSLEYTHPGSEIETVKIYDVNITLEKS